LTFVGYTDITGQCLMVAQSVPFVSGIDSPWIQVCKIDDF